MSGQSWVQAAIRGEEPVVGTMPIKILFLGSNPLDTVRLGLPEELRNIDRCLQASRMRDGFQLLPEWAPTVSDLFQKMLRNQPTIVHFSGHGSEQGELIFADENGRAKPVPAEALASFFAKFAQAGLRCVVLNACYTAEQAAAIAKSVDFVVGISERIQGEAAREFAAGFYAALFDGNSLPDAFQLGCSKIGLASLAGSDRLRQYTREGVASTALQLNPKAPGSTAVLLRRVMRPVVGVPLLVSVFILAALFMLRWPAGKKYEDKIIKFTPSDAPPTDENQTYFYIKNGHRHLIPSKTIVNYLYHGVPEIPVEEQVVHRFPLGTEYTYQDGMLVKNINGKERYLIINNELRHILDKDIAKTYGCTEDDLFRARELHSEDFDPRKGKLVIREPLKSKEKESGRTRTVQCLRPNGTVPSESQINDYSKTRESK